MRNRLIQARAVSVTRSPDARFLAWWRLQVFGLRVHHGAAGAALVAGAYLPRRLAARLALLGAGALLMAHDWPDRWWLP